MDVVVCPKCFRKIDPAKEFRHSIDGSYFSSIKCAQCRYDGLPIQVTEKEYKKLVKSKK